MLAVTGLATGIAIAGAGQAQAGTLALTVFPQERSQWCWAASSQAVIHYLTGQSDGQCELVKVGNQSDDCADVPGSFSQQLGNIYAHYGINGGELLYAMPTMTEIRQDIDRSKPLQIRYGYHSSDLTQGHIVTISGYSGTDTVYWADPGSGTIKSGTHAYLSNNATWQTTHGRHLMG